MGLPVGKPGWAPAPEAIANSSNTAWKDEDELLDAKDHIDEFKKVSRNVLSINRGVRR